MGNRNRLQRQYFFEVLLLPCVGETDPLNLRTLLTPAVDCIADNRRVTALERIDALLLRVQQKVGRALDREVVSHQIIELAGRVTETAERIAAED